MLQSASSCLSPQISCLQLLYVYISEEVQLSFLKIIHTMYNLSLCFCYCLIYEVESEQIHMEYYCCIMVLDKLHIFVLLLRLLSSKAICSWISSSNSTSFSSYIWHLDSCVHFVVAGNKIDSQCCESSTRLSVCNCICLGFRCDYVCLRVVSSLVKFLLSRNPCPFMAFL